MMRRGDGGAWFTPPIIEAPPRSQDRRHIRHGGEEAERMAAFRDCDFDPDPTEQGVPGAREAAPAGSVPTLCACAGWSPAGVILGGDRQT
jgi:hypothetical protein